MVYIEAKNAAHVADLLSKNKRAVLKFGADFCPACRKIKDIIPTIAGKYGKVLVIAVDSKKMDEVCKLYKVDDIPCFVPIYRGSTMGKAYNGTNLEKIEWMIMQMNDSSSRSKISGKPPSKVAATFSSKK